MSSQAASICSLISALLLSDHRVLRLSWDTAFTHPLEWSELRVPTYLASQAWTARLPDHVFDSAWQFLAARQQLDQGILLTAINTLINEFLELRHREVRIRRDLLGPWQQGLVSRISSLPILASADVSFDVGRYTSISSSALLPISFDHLGSPWRRQILPLLRPDEAIVADYVEREGLHETHLHLNGSTHAEICWLRAISHPHNETRDFVEAWTHGKNSKHIRELVGQVNPELTPLVFYQHLRTASRLREWLIAAAEDRVALEGHLPESCQHLLFQGEDEWSAGLKMPNPTWRSEPDLEGELRWMAGLIFRLQRRPSVQLTRMFHAYLLLSNEYYRLLVQSEAQYGFDQFQKFTLTELREPAERDYRTRFHAMHGPRSATSTVGYLEGRFAPKDTPTKAYKLFKAILGGYLNYLRDTADTGSSDSRNPRNLSGLLIELDQYFRLPVIRHRSIHRLTLVAHFIKQPWPPAQMHKAGPFRHYPLDLQLRRMAGVLLSMLARWNRLQTWVRGIDAAANELHAPPEIFAPVFRVCRRAGLSRHTYHAGEDFRHLLSGIATMWEALTLLDLRNGDRIGHGTAMGIRPTLWLDRMPPKIILSRNEWMLGVLAAWQLLRDRPGTQACSYLLQRELEEVAEQIFGCSLAARDVENAMALRGLSRYDLMLQQTGDEESCHISLSDLWRQEAGLVRAACQNQPQPVKLLWRWLSDPGVQERSDEMIAKDAHFLDAPTYVQLQQSLMQHVAERGVLIETMPSSNVRISQYYNIDEHHSLRWMRVPGYIEEGDPEIMVSLGSDDPGIFASDLETEFYLLYGALRRAGLGNSEALGRLSALNERGRTYRFHHPVLA